MRIFKGACDLVKALCPCCQQPQDQWLCSVQGLSVYVHCGYHNLNHAVKTLWPVPGALQLIKGWNFWARLAIPFVGFSGKKMWAACSKIYYEFQDGNRTALKAWRDPSQCVALCTCTCGTRVKLALLFRTFRWKIGGHRREMQHRGNFTTPTSSIRGCSHSP